MISKCINVTAILCVAASLVACSSSSSSDSSGSTATGTSVTMSAAPAPSQMITLSSGEKSFMNNQGDTIVLKKAYLVVSSTTIETDCSSLSFTAALDGLFNILVPAANAHTTATPTSTGEPHVINLLATDNEAIAIGGMSPSVADYCGVDVDMFAADADTLDLPTGAGEPDMVGKSVYIEASYVDSMMTSGSFVIDTSATLINRKLLLSALMMISASNPNDSINIGIEYDTWFNNINLVELETGSVSEVAAQVNSVLNNITNSMHHN